MDRSDDAALDETLQALAEADEEVVPPDSIEEAVVEAAVARRMSGRAAHLPLAARWLAAAVALVLMFLAGRMTSGSGQAAPPVEGAQYLLLLYEGPDFLEGESVAEENLVTEYAAWARGLHEAGVRITGEKLGPGGIRLEGVVDAQTERIVMSPDLARDAPSGFFMVRAADLAEAERIALGMPHLRHGGTVVVHPIEPTPGP